MNTVPGAIFTIPYFICNLQMDPISKRVTLHLVVKPCKDKHSILLGPIVSYKENELLWIQSLELYSQHFIYFHNIWIGSISWSVTLHLAVKHCKDKHSILLGLLVSYEENELLWIRSLVFEREKKVWISSIYLLSSNPHNSPPLPPSPPQKIWLRKTVWVFSMGAWHPILPTKIKLQPIRKCFKLILLLGSRKVTWM